MSVLFLHCAALLHVSTITACHYLYSLACVSRGGHLPTRPTSAGGPVRRLVILSRALAQACFAGSSTAAAQSEAPAGTPTTRRQVHRYPIMEGREPLTPWVNDFKHSIAVIGSEPLTISSNDTSNARSKGPAVFPASLTLGEPAAYQRHSFVGLPRQHISHDQLEVQLQRQDRPWSTIEYQPYRSIPSAARAPDTNIRRRPVSSMPTATPSTTIGQQPLASVPGPTRPSWVEKLFRELPVYHSLTPRDTEHRQAAISSTQPDPLPEVPRASLAQIAVNNAKTMSLRRFLHWVVTQPEIHPFQSISYAQTKDTEKPNARAIFVLRNLVVLEEMYRPGRVMLPSQELYHIVQVIHRELQHMRRMTEDTVEQIQQKSHSMDATEFITWLSYHFTVCGRRFSVPKPGFFYNPDSLTNQQRLVDRAFEFYHQPDVLHDRTLTNALGDIILRAILGYRDEAFRSNGKYKSSAQRQAERRVAREAAAKSSPGADRLLFQHDTPR